MKEERLQLRVSRALKEQALAAAARRHMTVSALVTLLLRQLIEADWAERNAGAGNDVEQI